MAKSITLTPQQALQGQFLFQKLPAAELDALVGKVQFQKIPKGQVIFKKGEMAQDIILLIAGRGQLLQTSEDGKAATINTVEAGQAMGELSAIDGGVRAATLVASTEMIIGRLDNLLAKELFIRQPAVTERILYQLCQTVRRANQMQSVLTVNRAHARIYHLLLNTAKLQANNLLTISDLPTQHDIAALANVSRETVSRALQVLIREGIVKKDTKRLIICDQKKLEEMAKGAH